jgi:hypothetical protein
MIWNTNTSKLDVVIPAECITETELNSKSYLTTIPAEYITETELNAKGYLTSIPVECITESELATNNYTKTQIDTNNYTKTQVQSLAGTNMTFNSGTNKFDVSVPASYSDTNVINFLSNYQTLSINWDSANYPGGVILSHQYRDLTLGSVVNGGGLSWGGQINIF